jgi:hypothetical protein
LNFEKKTPLTRVLEYWVRMKAVSERAAGNGPRQEAKTEDTFSIPEATIYCAGHFICFVLPVTILV